jgi:hypothetical protein
VVINETRPHGCLHLVKVSLAGCFRWRIQELWKALDLANASLGS